MGCYKTPVHYRVYDFTGPDDLIIARRETFPQALEAAYRYIAEHAEANTVAVFHWAPGTYEGGPSAILWTYDPSDASHQQRVQEARRAVEAAVPENLHHGLP